MDQVVLCRVWLDLKACRYRQEVLPEGREEARGVLLFTPALQALLLPFRAEGYLGGARLFLGETLRMEVNPTLPEGLFTPPAP